MIGSRWTQARLVWARLALIAALGAACGPAPEAPPASTQAPTGTAPLTAPASPIAEAPASGGCDSVSGAVVTVSLNPDAPSPRCVRVTPDQHLELVNNTGAAATVQLARVVAEVPSGTEYAFLMAFGTYLAPGVHRISVSTYGESGPQLWLVEASLDRRGPRAARRPPGRGAVKER